jgi:hypothetical protein
MDFESRSRGTRFLFSKGTVVQHLKTQGVYTIMETPESLRLEKGNQPAYLYTDHVIQWVRPQSEMEDGRFILFTGENQPSDKPSL